MTASRSADDEGEYCLTKAAMRSLKRLWRMLIWPPIRSHDRQCRESTGESANTSRRLGAREQTQGWLGLMSAEMFKQRRNLTAVINSAGLRWVRRPQEDLQRDQEDQWALFVFWARNQQRDAGLATRRDSTLAVSTSTESSVSAFCLSSVT